MALSFLPVLASVPAEEGMTSLSFILVGAWVLLLAIFTGVELISKVPPTLHTPLMSGSNAISGITVVGAIIAAGHGAGVVVPILGTLAVIMATINVVGGFLVTHRMLEMFRRKG